MSRHSRTSPAFSVLKLCKEIERSLNDEDMNAMRKLIYDIPGISDENRCAIIDLVTVAVLKHESYRNAMRELKTFLNDLAADVNHIE